MTATPDPLASLPNAPVLASKLQNLPPQQLHQILTQEPKQ